MKRVQDHSPNIDEHSICSFMYIYRCVCVFVCVYVCEREAQSENTVFVYFMDFYARATRQHEDDSEQE